MDDAVLALQNWRILLVEDDYIIATDIAYILESAGAVVLGPVGHVEDALDLLRQSEVVPDIALLDLDLHGTPSYPIADALIARNVPIVFASGFSGEVVAPDYRGYPRLVKPVSEDALIAVLASTG